MDWSGGAGYAGLYANVNKRESAKQDLATLSVLNKEIQADKVEQEQAQLKEQAYYDQISKFADTLLAPDRARINEKAKSMSAMIRNNLKQYGGDLTKFFENGGHRIMGDYKSGIVNSEESSTYLDNKKNMERILDMQQKGFGHLINPTDMFNLQRYQKEGKGRITATGMLTEKKMPPTDSEVWGKEMTPEKILHYEGNYAKFYQDYITTYGDEGGKPTQEDLLQFVQNQHSDILGTNWQKPMAERRAAYDEFSDQRDFEFDVHKDQRDFGYGKYRDDVADYQTDRTHDLALRKQRMEEEMALIELYGKDGGAKKTSDSKTGYMDSMGNPISKEDADATNSFMYDTDVMTQTMNNEVDSIDKITSAASDVYKAQFGEGVLLDNTIGYRDDSDLGTGGVTGSELIRSIANDYHRIRGSKLLLNGQVAQTALKNSGILPMDEKGEIRNLDLSQNPDVFSANGVRVKDFASDKKLKPGSTNFLTGENFSTEINKTVFKTKGIVTGFIGKDKNGNDIMITDIVKSGDSGNFTPKGKASKEWEERNYDKKTQPRHAMFVVIENEKGQVLYKPLDANLEKSMLGQFAAMNVGKIKAGKAVAAKEAKNRIDNRSGAGEIYKSLKRDPQAMAKIRQQVQVASNNPNTAKFDAAASSFYTHLKNQYEENGQDKSLNSLVNEGTFYELLRAATDTPEEKSRLEAILQNPKAGAYDFVNFIIKNTDYDGADDWIETLKYIQTVKYTK